MVVDKNLCTLLCTYIHATIFNNKVSKTKNIIQQGSFIHELFVRNMDRKDDEIKTRKLPASQTHNPTPLPNKKY
jgi:hypothetical protein